VGLKIGAGGTGILSRLAGRGAETMAGKTAPANGVIRHDETGSARRIAAGAVIPEGWTFDDGRPKPAAPKKPKENTRAAGPSETLSTAATPAPS
jgi:hypothetical protein